MSERNIRNAHVKCLLDDAAQYKANHNNYEKIRIPIPKEAEWKDITSEWLWVEKVADEIYALRNIPIYAYGLSFDDRFHLKNCEGILEIDDLVERGGHSTYRIIAFEDITNDSVKQLLEKLVDLGCDTEAANRLHVAIDVPPETDAKVVFGLLQIAEESGTLSFEEGHCGHNLSPPG